MENTKKLTKTKARKIARELAPIVEDYIPEWDRYHKRVTIKALAEDLLCDLEHTRYSIEEIRDNAKELNDLETVETINKSEIWNY